LFQLQPQQTRTVPQRPHRTEDLVTAESAENDSATKKAAKRKNGKYESFPHKEEQCLVNLWKDNFEQPW
jgi:hypothetical protein